MDNIGMQTRQHVNKMKKSKCVNKKKKVQFTDVKPVANCQTIDKFINLEKKTNEYVSLLGKIKSNQKCFYKLNEKLLRKPTNCIM